ncbi:MAG: F0F1 ATP synthase subunit gamma [Gammaproteobacteria bacterium]|nr:F0F1 ATP synthase subunit gamma [Gammaproteobacteria bacterium]
MSTGKEIKSKIGGVKKTRKITRAMEMVAASKMRKSQIQMQRARPYAEKIRQVIGHVANSNPEYSHPFMEQRPVKRAAYIVVSSDRGLCGGLNTNLFRKILQHIKTQKEIDLSFCPLGVKAENFFTRYGGNVVAHADHLGEAPAMESLIGIVKVLLDAYREEKLDAVYICSNEFVNTMVQRPTVTQLLPIVHASDESSDHHWDYIYEPDDARKILNLLLTRYIESQVYQAVVENIACEQAARMVAMKNATDNAGKMIDDLNLAYNKARQAAITQELAELVAGAAAV